MITKTVGIALIALLGTLALGCDDKSGSGGAASGSGKSSGGGGGGGGGGSAALKAAQDYEKDSCACKDTACVTAATKKYGDAQMKVAATGKPEEVDAITKAAKNAADCMTKVTMAAATGAVSAAMGASPGGDSKVMQAAVAARKCKKPDESDADRKMKAEVDSKEMDKMKLSDKSLDCFIACKTKDDVEKCEKIK